MGFEEYATGQLPRLLGLARVLCRDGADAEDLVQEVLVKVYARWDSIAGLQARDAYVHRILVNQFLSWRRRTTRRLAPAGGSELVEDAVSAGGADEMAAFVERHTLLAELRQLPARQRAVIGLRYFLDLSDEQIADALGCSPNTVRVHASRALAALRIAHAEAALRTKER